MNLKPENKKQVDHINHNGLDNTKKNLRVVTNQQNQMNKRKRKNTSSKYKGVTWHKQHKKWYAQIVFNGKHFYLGLFNNQKHAAILYDKKAKELFKHHARLNFP